MQNEKYPPAGLLLREWRKAQRLSQFDLALACGISARHIGYVEIGKSRPSRDTLRRFSDALSLSLRERNALLLAAGLAPQYSEAGLGSPELERMRGAVDLILTHHNPYPAFVLNRQFDVLNMNQAAQAVGNFISRGRPPKHDNLLHQIFDPEDLRPIIDNWTEVAMWFLSRLQEEIAAAPGNMTARRLLDELLIYPDVPTAWRRAVPGAQAEPVLTIDFRSPAGNLRFFETITTFAAPLSVTLDELRIDCAYPADDQTSAICRQLADGQCPP